MLRRYFLAAPALLARERFDEIGAAFQELTQRHAVRHAVLHWRMGAVERVWTTPGARADAVFLLASITKPMTAGAVMKLVDGGEVKLEDPAKKYLPEFSAGERGKITVRHLLTHTTGLPDMLPDNDELRRRHAPLRDFVRGALTTPLLFAPGAECRYQSMGILLAAEIVERVTRQSLPRFLQQEVFTPLGMKAASLGLGGRALASLTPSQLSTPASDWDWNSAYWRGLGAPWGGAFAPAADVARMLRAFARPEEQKIWKPSTAARMTADQNAGLNKSWGIGWAVNARPSDVFGKACSPRAFGHSGSTGTLCWADPARDATLVLLTGRPAAEIGKTVLQPLSGTAASSMAMGQ